MKKYLVLLFVLLPFTGFSQAQPWNLNPTTAVTTFKGVTIKPSRDIIRLQDSANTTQKARGWFYLSNLYLPSMSPSRNDGAITGIVPWLASDGELKFSNTSSLALPYLPLSGGTMTGDIASSSSSFRVGKTASYLDLFVGSAKLFNLNANVETYLENNYNGNITLSSRDVTDATTNRSFQVRKGLDFIFYGANVGVDVQRTALLGPTSFVPKSTLDSMFVAASGVTSVTGTINRITSTGGATPVIDISSSYVGQSSIQTLGNINSGAWLGTPIGSSYGGTGLTSLGSALQNLRVNAGGTALEYYTPSGAGTGTVTSVSVASANGFSGSVATATTTPAITIATTVTGLIKGNGTTISAAISGTDIKTVNGTSLIGSGNLAVGDALVANPLSQFAATTSSQLLGVLSDETGTGAAVFGTAPTLSNPVVGTQARSDNSTKAASTAFVKTAYNYTINVKDYGAVGDGVTNDAAAINAAITAAAVAQTVFFPDGNYLIGSTSIAVNKTVNILGGFSSITVTGNVPAIIITANNVKIEHIRCLGSGKGSGSTLQHGISSDGYYYMGIRSCEFYNMGGAGLYIKNTNVSGLRYGARVNECYFNANNMGYLADISAEYISFTNCYFQYNTTGVTVRAGNNSFCGGSISDNTSTGVKLEGGTLNVAYVNDGHGMFSGVLINHNKTGGTGNNLSVDGITLGYTFTGCHFYDSGIYLKNCVGITFSACHIAPIALFFEGSKGTMFVNNTLYRAYGFAVNNNYNSGQSQTNWINNKSYDGLAGSFLENIYGGYFNGAVAAGTSIATGSSNIDFTPALQSTGNNLTQTLYAFWNATNKGIKNFGLGDNKVKINLNLTIGINALADPSKMLVTLDQYDTDGTTFIGQLAVIPYWVYDETSTTNRQLIFSLQGIYGIDLNRSVRIGVVNNTGYSASIVANVLGANSAANGFNRIVCEGL